MKVNDATMIRFTLVLFILWAHKVQYSALTFVSATFLRKKKKGVILEARHLIGCQQLALLSAPRCCLVRLKPCQAMTGE